MQDKYHALKVIMFDRKVTQGALAQKIEISEQSLNAKLNERQEFTISEAEKMINFLGIENPSDIFFNSVLRGA